MTLSLRIDESLEKGQSLWRYMDLAKFVSMLEQNALWLARADTFRDRHEGRFPDEMRILIEKAYEGFCTDGESSVKDADDFQDYLLKNAFVSCWHRNSDENMVMWEIYGRDNNAVAVQTTVGSMAKSIDASNLIGHSLKLKRVVYQKADEIPGAIPYEDCFFRKRPHFSFEREVRISLDTYSPSNPSKRTKYGHKLPVHVNTLVEKILVHPDSQDWYLSVIRSIADRYSIDAPVSQGEFGTK